MPKNAHLLFFFSEQQQHVGVCVSERENVKQCVSVCVRVCVCMLKGSRMCKPQQSGPCRHTFLSWSKWFFFFFGCTVHTFSYFCWRALGHTLIHPLVSQQQWQQQLLSMGAIAGVTSTCPSSSKNTLRWFWKTPTQDGPISTGLRHCMLRCPGGCKKEPVANDWFCFDNCRCKQPCTGYPHRLCTCCSPRLLQASSFPRR